MNIQIRKIKRRIFKIFIVFQTDNRGDLSQFLVLFCVIIYITFNNLLNIFKMNSSTIPCTPELSRLSIVTSSSTLVCFLTHGSLLWYTRDLWKLNVTLILFGGMFMGFQANNIAFFKRSSVSDGQNSWLSTIVNVHSFLLGMFLNH